MHTKSIAFGLLAAAAAASASDVVQLKKDNFDDFVKSNDIVLAECEFLPFTILPQSSWN
jgi:protein disulfide-isomerase A1